MHECINAWMNKCMKDEFNKLSIKWKIAKTEEIYIYEREEKKFMNEWMNEWMNVWMSEWMNKLITKSVDYRRNASIPLNLKIWVMST